MDFGGDGDGDGHGVGGGVGGGNETFVHSWVRVWYIPLCFQLSSMVVLCARTSLCPRRAPVLVD